ncbi:EcsC family protein [Pedococcus ginsenosidimutans]|uniref:EcsC family protein n=1 Tax=Pedococcus ginsenosidimutans TaxID=490570 RepID=A0ABP8XWV7_9MICO
MGFLGLGSEDVQVRPASALEQAKAGREDTGMFSGAVTGLVEQLLDLGIDGKGPFDSAQKVADVKRAERPDAENAVDAVVQAHLKLAAAGGFVTGLGGFITLPVALPVNVVEFYVVATRTVAAIASLRGYDIKQPEIRSAVLLTLVGADADDLLKKAGVMSTGRLSNLAAQRLPGPALMVVNKAVGFRLLSTAGKKTLARFGKGVPVIGGVVGAGLDTYLLKRIADHARHEFPPRPKGH